jgi:hypothetical protein
MSLKPMNCPSKSAGYCSSNAIIRGSTILLLLKMPFYRPKRRTGGIQVCVEGIFNVRPQTLDKAESHYNQEGRG